MCKQAEKASDKQARILMCFLISLWMNDGY